ncbi:hypothetical protein GGR56DRAFT_658775 [Xylariaceae sp. FL0804]|nr:hypothetical protein GGR56DRAFT_658775 [Xylariaceae sp. FL0804]
MKTTMENLAPAQSASPPPTPPSPDSPPASRKRSGSGASILSKFPFLRTSESKSSLRSSESRHGDATSSASPVSPNTAASAAPIQHPRALAAVTQQQQKTRRRRGSLRKVALLGRGAARERREPKIVEPVIADDGVPQSSASPPESARPAAHAGGQDEACGLGISDATPRPSMDGFATRAALVEAPPAPHSDADSQVTSPTISYTSTTDEEDAPLSIPVRGGPPPPGPPSLPPAGLSSLPAGSSSGSYFPTLPPPDHGSSLQRRRSVHRAKSPLSLQGLTASPLPAAADEDHDYGETEWWGWVVLAVTWSVFVVGMGSCLNVWSWAWDVGTTPYAPPELEDDPTLPIVGYYPALLILTCIMAWVWVLGAWMGMKYFRHAKISGD